MNRFIVALAVFSLTQAASASSMADQFGAARLPVKAMLTIDAEPVLCGSLLADVEGAFESTVPDIDIEDITKQSFPPLKWESLGDDNGDEASALSRLDLDLDGTGTKQVIINRDNPFNSQGDWHYGYVFPSAAVFEAARQEIVDRWSKPPDEQALDPNKTDGGGRPYYPDATLHTGSEVSTGNVWADHALFGWRGRYYFFSGKTPFDRLTSSDVDVFRLRADGHVEKACRIELPTAEKQFAKLQSSPAVGSLLGKLNAIGSGAGADCGTLHAGAEHDAQLRAAEWRAAYRPWAVALAPTPDGGAGSSTDFDQRTQDFFKDWGLQDLWSWREYQTFLAHLAPAESGVAGYLGREFSLPADKAASEAGRIVKQLIGISVEIPREYSGGQGNLNAYFPQPKLGRALMLRDQAVLDELLRKATARGQNDGPAGSEEKKAIAGSLEYAVEWPWGLQRVLTAGADPNAENDFGKTPLMVAAHLDRPDAVAALLKAGARINAQTRVGESGGFNCGPQPAVSGRTALMYAAENASPIVIKELLGAGADPKMRDSKGDSADSYLARNPRLTGDERKLGIVGVAGIADHFIGPGFDCQRATTSAEKSICSSDVLKMFDGEMTRAYGGLRAASDPQIVAEQRAWLSLRDKSCGAGPSQADCLSELFRTRIRYLHDRLKEPTATTAKLP